MKKYCCFILCLLTIGCSNPSKDPLRNFIGSYRNYFITKGKVVGKKYNETYYSPNKVFSVGVRLSRPGAIVKDTFRKDFGKNKDYEYNVGTVSFMDDFGRFYRIDAFELPEKHDFSKEQLKILFDGLFMEYEMGLYRELDPNAKILYKNYLDIDGTHIGYYVVYLANGSTYSSNGRRVDVFRSSFVFFKNNYAYVVSNQYRNEDTRKPALELNDEVIKKIQEELTKIYKTMKFNNEI
ncbi:MAG: hypothetical protein IJ853_00500 [Rickettsiales bacterium]|nr:hypothetical protein [Rickettsiales bacterium]